MQLPAPPTPPLHNNPLSILMMCLLKTPNQLRLNSKSLRTSWPCPIPLEIASRPSKSSLISYTSSTKRRTVLIVKLNASTNSCTERYMQSELHSWRVISSLIQPPWAGSKKWRLPWLIMNMRDWKFRFVMWRTSKTLQRECQDFGFAQCSRIPASSTKFQKRIVAFWPTWKTSNWLFTIKASDSRWRSPLRRTRTSRAPNSRSSSWWQSLMS